MAGGFYACKPLSGYVCPDEKDHGGKSSLGAGCGDRLWKIRYAAYAYKKALIVSTPYDPAVQDVSLGNSYEAHAGRWKAADFSGFKANITMRPIDENQTLIAKIPASKGA